MHSSILFLFSTDFISVFLCLDAVIRNAHFIPQPFVVQQPHSSSSAVWELHQNTHWFGLYHFIVLILLLLIFLSLLFWTYIDKAQDSFIYKCMTWGGKQNLEEW